MAFELTQQEFLERNGLSEADWIAAGCEWQTLVAIAIDHEAHLQQLQDTAEFFVRTIQKIHGVHSVRWRVKNTEHLLEKIVRKRLQASEKYAAIDVNNYFELITDLVGLRALHLFKEDCFDIDREMRNLWHPIETPIAYIRAGDPGDLTIRLQDSGFDIKTHTAGYRSIHYVFSSQPLQRRVTTEVQVRTIFEEGWSEIDHKVRYPNFSDDPLVAYFLAIFNRMAGSADEMGSFVRGLSHKLSDLQLQITQATENEEASLRAVEDSIAELGKLKQKDSESQALVDKLTAEIANLRKTTTLEGIVSAPTIPGATTPAGMASTGIKVLQARSEDLDPNRRRALTRRALANLAALGVMPIVGGGGGGG